MYFKEPSYVMDYSSSIVLCHCKISTIIISYVNVMVCYIFIALLFKCYLG